MQWPDGYGDCCGYCLPATEPRPQFFACLLPCMMPTTCPCIAGKCTAVPIPRDGGATSMTELR
jgi:hypothetical protein